MSHTADHDVVHRKLQYQTGGMLEDCIESECARRDWQQAQLSTLVRRDVSALRKRSGSHAQIVDNCSKLQVELEKQLGCNQELRQKCQTLEQENRRCRPAWKDDRQAIRSICKEYASSSMVATMDDGVSAQNLVERLRERLQKRHKRHQDTLRRVRERNHDLECALENARPEELQACRRTIRDAHRVLSTTLQLVPSETSVHSRVPTCGHIAANMKSFTACGRILCQACRDDLEEEVMVEGWVRKCPWCLKPCAVDKIPVSLQFPWTPIWKDAMDSLSQAKDDLGKMF